MLKRNWLIVYNGITLLAWMVFAATVLADGMQMSVRGAIVLAVAQGLAVFEVAHAIMGIAGSNWLLTTLQVASRFLVAALIMLMTINGPTSGLETYGYPLIALAWAITEIVRALSYMADLLHRSWPVVTWLRYSLFIGLYPIGVSGEFLILYGFWQWRGGQLDLIALALAAIALSYVVFFPKLFGHMLRQRKKKLAIKP